MSEPSQKIACRVELPMQRRPGYVPTRIDLRLTPERGRKLKDIFHALSERGATLDGRLFEGCDLVTISPASERARRPRAP